MRLLLLNLTFITLFAGCSSLEKKAVVPTSPSTPVAPAVVKKEEPKKNEISCQRSDEKRTVEIEAIEPHGCKLWYSRNGTRSSVASSSIGTMHCEQVREKIKTNLTNAGFNCNTADTKAADVKATDKKVADKNSNVTVIDKAPVSPTTSK